jgi:hypothetical protein
MKDTLRMKVAYVPLRGSSHHLWMQTAEKIIIIIIKVPKKLWCIPQELNGTLE